MNLKSIPILIKRKAFRFLLVMSGLLGIGILPCPDCGSPMIVHLWPLALLYSLRHFLHHHREKTRFLLDDIDGDKNK